MKHPISFKDLFETGIPHDLWHAIKDKYKGLHEKIIWNGQFSRVYKLLQGVGQGKILSPLLYKIYAKSLLILLEKSGKGKYIEDIFVGCPTCADNVLILCQPQDSKEIINIASDYYKTKRYNIQPSKSEITSKLEKTQL